MGKHRNSTSRRVGGDCLVPSAFAVIFILVWTGCNPGESQDDCNSGEEIRADGRCVASDTGGGDEPADTGSALDDDTAAPEVDADASSGRWGDRDGDRVPNVVDNCPDIANPDQKDPDGDLRGTTCDNCPKTANFDQRDSNGDDVGDRCSGDVGYDRDRDRDGDGTPDIRDNCPTVSNPSQQDRDSDSVGDKCDNCPGEPNPAQTNTDGDDQGDACEPKPAGDICKRKTGNFKQVTPNIYFVIDRSTSMRKTTSTGNTRMVDAKAGLDETALALGGELRVGMATYPCAPTSTQCGHVVREFLSVGQYSTQDLITSYRSNYNRQLCPNRKASSGPSTGLGVEYPGLHCTETGSALRYIHQNNLYLDPQDPLSQVRNKAVVLITDGCACDGGSGNCQGGDQQTLAERWAKKMASSGIPLYVVGFNVARCFPNKTNDPASKYLNPIAKKGGTDAGAPGGDRFYTPDTPKQLASALSKISTKVTSCEYKLDAQSGISPSKIWVEIDGSYISESEFSYNSGTNTVQLSDSVCDKVNQSDPQTLKIVAGCASECQKSEEICNYEDDDCDGEIDEGCDCSPETCNDRDDDCDGTIDEGCASCSPVENSCADGTSCCEGSCVDGTCELCRPVGTFCRTDDECCSGTCSNSDGMARRCSDS